MSPTWSLLDLVSDLFVYGRVILAMEWKSVMPMDEPFLDNRGFILYIVPKYIKVSIFDSTKVSDFVPGLPLFFLRLAKRELW